MPPRDSTSLGRTQVRSDFLRLGRSSITKDIFVNGLPSKATTNLQAALWHFRNHDVLRQNSEAVRLRLWVDAICLHLDRYQTKCRRNLRLDLCFWGGFILRI